MLAFPEAVVNLVLGNPKLSVTVSVVGEFQGSSWSVLSKHDGIWCIYLHFIRVWVVMVHKYDVKYVLKKKCQKKVKNRAPIEYSPNICDHGLECVPVTEHSGLPKSAVWSIFGLRKRLTTWIWGETSPMFQLAQCTCRQKLRTVLTGCEHASSSMSRASLGKISPEKQW